jgi:heavy metal translocating P-type ATPase
VTAPVAGAPVEGEAPVDARHRGLVRRLGNHSGWLVLVPALALLLAGAVAAALGNTGVRDGCWLVAGLIGLASSTVAVVRGLAHRSGGVDILALLAVAGAIWTGEYLAGALIAVMVGTGSVLDQWAESAAHRELSLLVARSPRVAHRITDETVADIGVDDVLVGDLLHVGSGEIVPVDARLLESGTFDESALTGEAQAVERVAGDTVRSGVVNAGPPVRIVATSLAAESTYADVVRLVESAQADSSPYVRFADRLAWWFVPATLALAGVAWLASGDPDRVVAVLVVATPCPLLLAVPVAIISGVSQAARRGVVIKGGQVLEQLAAGRVLLFDKTGTLTVGRPTLASVHTAPGIEVTDLLAAAASLDQASPHVLASAIVRAAQDRDLPLAIPTDVQEVHGHGIQGLVDGRQVRIGKAPWILGEHAPAWARRARQEADLEGCVSILVALDGQPAGALLFADAIRPDATRMLRGLRAAGLTRMVLVTGDRADVAESVGRMVGVDEVRSEQTPADKVLVVGQEQAYGPVIMVGDGINDAPALAAADVGVAMAGRGATASSEAAGIVLTVDRIDRLGDAIAIARRARRIAGQSAWIGMGLSAVAMIAAALGFLPAAIGALLQEVIDVAAIGNALRVRAFRPPAITVMSGDALELLTRISADHDALRPMVDEIAATADGLQDADPDDPLAPVRALLTRLEDELLPHERQEERELLPIMALALGGSDPIGALSRTHAEIEHQVHRLRQLVESTDLEPQDAVSDARRTLYVLFGVLRLHNAQEEEGLFSLIG